jgi:ketosteroid isomerase-like protein
MSGRFGEAVFTASGRYTHVFFKEQSQWRLVSAQGTQIVN